MLTNKGNRAKSINVMSEMQDKEEKDLIEMTYNKHLAEINQRSIGPSELLSGAAVDLKYGERMNESQGSSLVYN